MKPLIFLATANAHKLAEFKEMFAESGFDCDLKGIDDVENYVSPVEDGLTFKENAFIKASSLKKLVPQNAFVFADDSGIVVDALNGAPGIYSARYAQVTGKNADDANNKKLLKNLENVPDEKRSARFVCALALISPNAETSYFEGKIEGFINYGESGANGFGYDPLFYLPELKKTTAELNSSEKNLISHRGNAFKKMVDFLKTNKKSEKLP